LQRNAIPARKLPERLRAASQADMVPIDFTMLRGNPPAEHLVGPGDVLGITIQGVIDQDNAPPLAQFPSNAGVDPKLASPAIGQPVVVSPQGELVLPLVKAVSVNGKSLAQVSELIRAAYVERDILKAGRDYVTVDLIRPRHVNVIVLREDSGPISPVLYRRDTQVISSRGTGHALELPIYQNDLLHALVETGGLPGVDGFNEVWILRNEGLTSEVRSQVISSLQGGRTPQSLMALHGVETRFIRVPLRICPGQSVAFSPDDVILREGDVVYIESRESDFFLGGGLLNGGKYYLPRDRDIDVFEAIAIASNATYGPAGANAAATNFRSGPGNIVPPTRVIVVRKVESGEQVKIHVDLRVAINDPRERLIVQPGDLVLLKYTPAELAGNLALNFVNVGYNINNTGNRN
jgi:hypothetical protein